MALKWSWLCSGLEAFFIHRLCSGFGLEVVLALERFWPWGDVGLGVMLVLEWFWPCSGFGLAVVWRLFLFTGLAVMLALEWVWPGSGLEAFRRL